MSVHVCLQHKHGRDLVYKFLSFLSRHVGLEEHAFGLHGGQSLIDPVDGKAFWQMGLESGDEFLDLLRLEAEGVVHIFGKADHELHGFLVAQNLRQILVIFFYFPCARVRFHRLRCDPQEIAGGDADAPFAHVKTYETSGHLSAHPNS